MTEKIMKIEGMACGHCSARVEKALNAIDGVSATVDLEAKTASITLTKPCNVSMDLSVTWSTSRRFYRELANAPLECWAALCRSG